MSACKWCGNLTKFPAGLPKKLAEAAKKGQYQVSTGKATPAAAGAKAAAPTKAGLVPPAKAPAKAAAASPTTPPAKLDKVDKKLTATGAPATMSAEALAAEIELQRHRMDSLAALQEQMAAEAEVKEAKAAEAAVISATKDEMAGLYQQLKWEESYLAALIDQTGSAVDERRSQHVSQIRWYKHRITDLKQPAEQVKSLKVGVNTAEKHLTAAGLTRDASKAAFEEAERKYKADLAAVESAATAFQEVKEQLEQAEEKLKEVNDLKKSVIPVAEATASLLMQCDDATRGHLQAFLAQIFQQQNAAANPPAAATPPTAPAAAAASTAPAAVEPARSRKSSAAPARSQSRFESVESTKSRKPSIARKAPSTVLPPFHGASFDPAVTAAATTPVTALTTAQRAMPTAGDMANRLLLQQEATAAAAVAAAATAATAAAEAATAAAAAKQFQDAQIAAVAVEAEKQRQQAAARVAPHPVAAAASTVPAAQTASAPGLRQHLDHRALYAPASAAELASAVPGYSSHPIPPNWPAPPATLGVPKYMGLQHTVKASAMAKSGPEAVPKQKSKTVIRSCIAKSRSRSLSRARLDPVHIPVSDEDDDVLVMDLTPPADAANKAAEAAEEAEKVQKAEAAAAEALREQQQKQADIDNAAKAFEDHRTAEAAKTFQVLEAHQKAEAAKEAAKVQKAQAAATEAAETIAASPPKERQRRSVSRGRQARRADAAEASARLVRLERGPEDRSAVSGTVETADDSQGTAKVTRSDQSLDTTTMRKNRNSPFGSTMMRSTNMIALAPPLSMDPFAGPPPKASQP